MSLSHIAILLGSALQLLSLAQLSPQDKNLQNLAITTAEQAIQEARQELNPSIIVQKTPEKAQETPLPQTIKSLRLGDVYLTLTTNFAINPTTVSLLSANNNSTTTTSLTVDTQNIQAQKNYDGTYYYQLNFTPAIQNIINKSPLNVFYLDFKPSQGYEMTIKLDTNKVFTNQPQSI